MVLPPPLKMQVQNKKPVGHKFGPDVKLVGSNCFEAKLVQSHTVPSQQKMTLNLKKLKGNSAIINIIHASAFPTLKCQNALCEKGPIRRFIRLYSSNNLLFLLSLHELQIWEDARKNKLPQGFSHSFPEEVQQLSIILLDK